MRSKISLSGRIRQQEEYCRLLRSKLDEAELALELLRNAQKGGQNETSISTTVGVSS